MPAMSEQRNLPSISAWNEESENAKRTRVTPLQAIYRHCLACMGGHEFPIQLSDGTNEARYRPVKDVRDCVDESCWLHPYRLGHNASRTGMGRRGNVVKTPTQRPISAAETHREGREGVEEP